MPLIRVSTDRQGDSTAASDVVAGHRRIGRNGSGGVAVGWGHLGGRPRPLDGTFQPGTPVHTLAVELTLTIPSGSPNAS